jgi:hypothetical protein
MAIAPGEAVEPVPFITTESGFCVARLGRGIAPRLFSAVVGVVTSKVHDDGIEVRFFRVNKGPEIAPPTSSA